MVAPHPQRQKGKLMTDRDIADWFGLSYSNFLVLHRVELEHMPTEWQHRFVQMLNEVNDAYDHLEHPQGYEVYPCRYVEAWEMSDAERKAAGVTSSLDDFPEGQALPEDPTEEEFTAHETAWEEAADSEVFHDADGNEVDQCQRVPIRVPDPIPHYRRGHVEPVLNATKRSST